MTRKILALTDFISAQDAATILTLKLGRSIRPDYIHKIRGVRSVSINATTKLYHRADIEQATIRERSTGHIPT